MPVRVRRVEDLVMRVSSGHMTSIRVSQFKELGHGTSSSKHRYLTLSRNPCTYSFQFRNQKARAKSHTCVCVLAHLVTNDN